MTSVSAFVLNHLAWFVSVPSLAVIVALLVFVPGAWAAVFSFLQTTFGRMVAILTFAVAIAGFAGWELRAQVDKYALADAEKSRLASINEVLRNQALASRQVETLATQRAEETEERNRTLQGKLDDYVKKLASAGKDGRCVLSADDVRSLRGIAGGSPRAPRAAR